MELVRIHRDAKGSLRFLEDAVARVLAMSHRFHGAPEAMVNDVWTLLATKSPALGFWVAVREETVVGHLLAFVRLWDGENVLWVSQVEADEKTTKAFRDLTLATLDEFVAQWNYTYRDNRQAQIKSSLMVTPRSENVWARHAGYEPYRALMRREVCG